MTENEIVRVLETEKAYMDSHAGKSQSEALRYAIDAVKEIQQYIAIGTVEEFKNLKEKNTPMELSEHNFQDEVHHYLCPSCRNIVSCNQNYCEECGQALET